jgi:hypothetical protein
MPEFTLPRGSRKRALALAAGILASLDELVAWKVTVEPVRHTRSLSQNAYLWAVPYKMLAEHTGYEPEELHEYFCGCVFGWKDKRVPKTPRNPEGIESVPVRTTTTDEQGKRSVLSAQAFSEFVAYIQRFAAMKCGIIVPDPDPHYALHREHAA